MWQFLARLGLAAASGGLMYLSVQPTGWWWAAIAGCAVLYASLRPWAGDSPRLRTGALLAAVNSLVLYLLSLPWIGELIGAFPYVALAVSLSVYSLLLGAGGAALARQPWGFIGFPFFFVAVEMLRSSVPFGGFPWVRLAWGQIGGPLANLAPWGGTALVSFATVAIGCGFVGLAARGVRLRGIGVAMIASLLLAGVLARTGIDRAAPTEGTATVAAIQGNVPRLGLDFAAQREAVLRNHVAVTAEAAQQEPQLDAVIWPENSSDVNPFSNPEALELIESVARAADAPLLVGTLTEDGVGERNTMQVFNADGSPGEHHYKKYLQPFGETMPFREVLTHVSDYVELAGDFKPGNGPGVVDMNGIKIGVATCYEVSFDQAFRSSVRGGAQLLATPTNNATFGFSDMTYQQLAMSRLRALETDRAVVVAATSGVSAIVHPDGRVSQSTGIFEPAYLVEELPLRNNVTFAVRFGSLIEWVMVIIGVVCALYAVYVRRVGRSVRSAETGTGWRRRPVKNAD